MQISQEEFIKLHQSQLTAINFPPSLYSKLYEKLTLVQTDEVDSDLEETFDLTQTLSSPHFLQKKPNSHSLIARKDVLEKNSNVFVFPHIWNKAGNLEDVKLRHEFAENGI